MTFKPATLEHLRSLLGRKVAIRPNLTWSGYGTVHPVLDLPHYDNAILHTDHTLTLRQIKTHILTAEAARIKAGRKRTPVASIYGTVARVDPSIIDLIRN